MSHNKADFHVDFALYGTQAKIAILNFHALAGGTPSGGPPRPFGEPSGVLLS